MGWWGEEERSPCGRCVKEEGKTIEAGERGRDVNISGGWFVAVACIKVARASKSSLLEQRGSLLPRS